MHITKYKREHKKQITNFARRENKKVFSATHSTYRNVCNESGFTQCKLRTKHDATRATYVGTRYLRNTQLDTERTNRI